MGWKTPTQNTHHFPLESTYPLTIARMCIAIIAHLGLHLWQIDFVAAYLNSVNKFEAYTEQAPGFIRAGEEDLVYRANKTVYGMMAGARYPVHTTLSDTTVNGRHHYFCSK